MKAVLQKYTTNYRSGSGKVLVFDCNIKLVLCLVIVKKQNNNYYKYSMFCSQYRVQSISVKCGAKFTPVVNCYIIRHSFLFIISNFKINIKAPFQPFGHIVSTSRNIGLLFHYSKISTKSYSNEVCYRA